ncbi:MAG TPA: TetR/AcrR family transcriptional regulator [Acidobacteriota bacterium]|nr:TetR/AcrR family transcriptional regulator [Acidobacteriota bacterium]
MTFRGRTKKDVVAEFRHAEILDAARKVFADKGFNEASVDEIAHTAGLAKGTLYLYYPSKRDLYWEALKSGLEALCTRLEGEVQAARDTETKIRTFMTTKLSYFEENRDFFKIYYAEFGHASVHPAYFHKDFQEYHVRQIHLVKSALQDGIRHGSVRDLPLEATAFAIVNLTRGIIAQRLLGWVSTRIEEDAAFMFDLTWKGIARR